MVQVRKATARFLKAIRRARFTLPELEREYRFQVVADRLEAFHGNQCKTARDLGIHRNTLGRILEEMSRAGRQVNAQRKPRRRIPPARVDHAAERAVILLQDCDDEPIPGCCA